MMFALTDLSLYARMLIGFCAVLIVVILIEVITMRPDSDALQDISSATTSSVSAANSATEALQVPPLAAYGEVLERPLFADSRRPPQQAAVATESVRAIQLSTKWKVTGIVVAGDNSFVHVEGLRDRKTVRLQVGMPLDGWQLQEIEPDQIVFSLGGESVTLQLHEDPADPAK
jgi:hypothetical protein